MSANLLERVTQDWRLTDDPVRRVIKGRRADGKETTILIVESWTPEPDAQLVALAYDHALVLRALKLGRAHFTAVAGALVVLTAPADWPLVFDFEEDSPLTSELREALRRAVGLK